MVRAVAETYADRLEALADLLAEAMSRPDTLRPVLPQAAATVSAFAAIYRFDLEAAHRLLEWAEPYRPGRHGRRRLRPLLGGHRRQTPARHPACAAQVPGGLRDRHRGGAALVCGATRWRASWRTALRDRRIRRRPRIFSRRAISLGPEGGGVDYLAARYVVGARIKAAQGDRDAAVSRLDEGMTVAEELRLPRLAAAINHERVRLRLPITPPEAARLRACTQHSAWRRRHRHHHSRAGRGLRNPPALAKPRQR